jgi:predicted transcriptional regulator
MTKPVVISARIDEATAALLDQVAKAQGRSRAWLVANAVKRMAEEEAAFLDFVQKGVDDFEAGRYLTHEEFVAEISQRRQRAKAA